MMCETATTETNVSTPVNGILSVLYAHNFNPIKEKWKKSSKNRQPTENENENKTEKSKKQKNQPNVE